MTDALAARLPLIAILRGLEPERAADVARVLDDAGFAIIEVPLNSPDPYASIAAIQAAVGERALVGAGTVLQAAEVDQLFDTGARLIVSPNCNPAVIARAAALGMIMVPGVFTPTEMFAALGAGASGLKVFPAEMMPPAALTAVRAVLPPAVPIYVVGGVTAANMEKYLAAGATGFGIGGSLFRPGKSLADIAADASEIVASFRAASGVVASVKGRGAS